MLAPSPPPPLGSGGAIRMLLPHLWPKGAVEMRVRVLLALSSLILAKIATVYVPVFYKQAVDALTVQPGLALVVPVGIVLAYGTARVLSLAFAEIRDAIFAKVGQRAIRRIALQVFRHLHALSLRFHLERQTGGLSRSIERGTTAIENLLRYMLFNILPTILEIVLVFGILWSLLDFWFALVTLTTVVAYLAYTIRITEWRLKFRRAMIDQDTRANARAIDSLLNYETVKYFGNEDHEARRFDEALKSYERAAVLSQSSLSLLNVGQAAIISVGLTAIMFMAARGIVNGTMTVGDFVLVNTYLLQLYQPLGIFGWVYREIKQSLVDMEKMFELMAVNREIQDAPGAPALALAGGAVAFEDVSFGYDARRPILRGVSFSVPAGKTVAIVGPSGAGKSTISRLLYRFYDVDGGRVLVDGQDIRTVAQDSVRAAIGVVPQDTVLFNDTIFYNIHYGRPGATEAEVHEAARLARIDAFVAGLPDGWATMVGERGLKLSGGEKQRVAIARTILKNPCILLFDEATSALDSLTEQEIQANLREISVGRTTLIIAHRLSTVVDADEILVLADGRIVERGSHAALLARNGAYAEMWARQQEAKDDPAVRDAVEAVEPSTSEFSAAESSGARPVPGALAGAEVR